MASTELYEWIDLVVGRDPRAALALRKVLRVMTARQVLSSLTTEVMRIHEYQWLRANGHANARTYPQEERKALGLKTDLTTCATFIFNKTRARARELSPTETHRAISRIQQTRILFEAFLVDEYVELLCLSLTLFDGTTDLDLEELWPIIFWRVPNANRLPFHAA